MTNADPGQIASIRQRLLNHAKARGEDFQFVLDRYAVERLMYRLSISPHRERFVLKGAMLFAAWFDTPHRPTRDADFLAEDWSPDADAMLAVVRDLLVLEVDDGLQFDHGSLGVTEIREEARYHGLRIALRSRLGTAACLVQWDIGFGDAVTPGPEDIELPTLLHDMPAPRMRVYPRETVFAEKLEAMVVLGMVNSRMKDYFDLLGLAREGRMEPLVLVQAIRATFARRGTPLPEQLPTGLSEAFGQDPGKQAQWKAFLSRNRLVAPDLEAVVAELALFVTPTLGAARESAVG